MPHRRWRERLPKPLALMFYMDELRAQLPSPSRYILAIVAAAIVFGARYFIFEPGEPRFPYLLSVPAVVFAAGLLGLGPALVAAVIGAALPLSLLDTTGNPLDQSVEQIGLAAYLTTSVLLTVLVRGLAAARGVAEGNAEEAERLNVQLETVLEEKETLLDSSERLLLELRHRTRNELQAVVSLLHMQARVGATDEERETLRAMAVRIQSVGHVHDMLSRQMERPDQPVYSRAFLGGLVGLLRDAVGKRSTATWDLHLEDHALPHTTATPLGVLVTELVMNSLKHAFPGDGPGHIRVIFRRDVESYVLRVEDDGVGRENSVPPRPGIGERVMKGVTANLKGALAISPPMMGSGTLCVLRFPVPPEGQQSGQFSPRAAPPARAQA